jgi:hypothetical protein
MHSAEQTIWNKCSSKDCSTEIKDLEKEKEMRLETKKHEKEALEVLELEIPVLKCCKTMCYIDYGVERYNAK